MESNSWRDCNELVTIEISIVFKSCRYCVNKIPNFATVTLSPFSECARHRVNTVLIVLMCEIQSNSTSLTYNFCNPKILKKPKYLSCSNGSNTTGFALSTHSSTLKGCKIFKKNYK